MKKILLFASAALLFAGCAKENITPTENPDNNSQKGDITLSFSASQTGFGTKAVIGETTGEGTSKSTAIKWQSTDQISVFDGDYKNCPFSTKDFSTETTTSCTFEGNVTAVANDYIAVYPYTKGATISDGVISGISLPATQIAVADSFDPSAALMAAKTVDGGRELAFKNLVGYVKVATDFDCKKIELCAASGEALAGEGTITFNNEGTPSFTLGEGATTITVIPERDGTLAAGTYYIAVPATTLAAGWSIRLTGTDDIVSTKKGSKDITFKQSTILNLGPISKIEPRYLTFSAESEQTFTMNFKPNKDVSAFTLGDGEYFEYRVGKDEWTQPTEKTISDVTFGGSHGDLQLRGISSKGTAVSDTKQWTTISFGNDTKVSCSGDIRTLVNYKDYENANTSNARFCNLFNNCLQLTSAPDLPATELASKSYSSMFQGCKSLTTAPKLPAEALAERCYYCMFKNCESLTTAPKLPATTLAAYCYESMFFGCLSLKSAPAKLPAEALAERCYYGMFCECSKLATAPALPAKTLADECYSGMFGNCSSLTTAPDLPATKLAALCYQEMFYGCTALSSVTMLATDISAEMCLDNWLNEAGTKAQDRILTLYNYDVYCNIIQYIPDNWRYNISYKSSY